MKKLLVGIFSMVGAFSFAQCEINTSATALTITCGQSVDLSAFGSSTGQVVLDEDFNSSAFGSGWSGSPGATSFSNPCSPGGVDGTPHAWMDDNTSVPRTLVSQAYDLTAATAGVSICFDLLFAEQGDNAPCEGPDEPDEGVYLQYSTDGGTTWIDIHYFDPNGGNDPALTNWGNWCFEIPAAAITGNTMFRWHQLADSGAAYDHWGIDNVQIFQNDINAEVTWLHDGYSYGVGSPGGVNPNAVTPTSTTTYTAQIVTGTGEVCTSDITITVVDPVYDVNVTANPTTICSGECSDITGDAQIVIDPGGIETYENAETGVIVGSPGIDLPFIGITPGDIDATMNINITGLNEPFVTNGQIQSVCITSLNVNPGFGCTSTSLADVAIVLVCPDGTEIILADLGQLSGNDITNMCFSTGGAAIGSGASPYTGSFEPNQPLSNIDGCTSNGVWTVDIRGENLETCIPTGSIGGWSITFDDPPIYQGVNAAWSPTAGLSSPNTIDTEACPTNTTDYILTLDNGTPGCPVHEETVTITVDPCGGCVPPSFTVTNPASFCIPFTYDLVNAVSGTGSNIVTYHGTSNDANSGANPLPSTVVNTSASYFVRVEDPTDPTCYSVQEIIVNGIPLDDASFSANDFCAGSANQASSVITTGGTFSFNPTPTDGATIDAATGEISNEVLGATYSVEYTTNGTCPSSSVQTVTVTDSDDASFTLTDFAVGESNQATNIATPGGTFSFNPAVTDGATIDPATGEISNGVECTTYAVEYTTSGACAASTVENVTVTSIADASFTLTNYCEGSLNEATNIATPGGTFSFNPVATDGATIDATTGEITNGVGGTEYTVEYALPGSCAPSSTETVTVYALPAIDAGVDQAICEGDQVTLSGQGGVSYAWDNSVNDGVAFTPTTSGSYTVTGTDANGCTNSDNVDVTVSEIPTALVSGTPVSGVAPLEVVFTNQSSNATNFNWDFGNGNTTVSNDLSDQSTTYTSAGTYVTTLTAINGGCVAEDTAVIIVLEPAGPIVTPPNVFTPNGDLTNDEWFINTTNVESIEVVILNRWGNVVFEYEGVDGYWDGMVKGKEAAEGVYFYIFTAKGFNGEEVKGHGHLTLIRKQ